MSRFLLHNLGLANPSKHFNNKTSIQILLVGSDVRKDVSPASLAFKEMEETKFSTEMTEMEEAARITDY